MKQFFIDSLRKYGTISEKAENELLPHISHCYKKKGSFLVKKGQINDNLYILEKGIIRFYHIRNEKEVTNWFCTEETTAFTSLCFFSGEPSAEYLELLEDSSLYYVSSKVLNKLYKTNIELSNIGRKIAEEYCLEFESRVVTVLSLTAEEKYRYLVRETPEILQRVPLGYIASFLGVTQETVSRIRKNFR